MRIWSKEEIEFLKNNYRKMKYEEISKALNRSLSSIWAKCHELKLTKDRWDKRKVINQLRDYKKKKGVPPSARSAGISLLRACGRYFGTFNNAKKAAGLEIKLNRNVLPHSAHKSSKEFAYIVGLILGDGNLRFQKSKERTSYVISFSSKDKELTDKFIENFKVWANYTPKIYIRKTGWRRFPSGTKSYYQRAFCTQISFMDAWFMVKKLKDSPMYCINFFEKEHYRWLLKGLWDAEGSIRLNNKSLRIHFANSDNKIIKLYKYLLSFYGIRHSINLYKNGCKDVNISDTLGTLEFLRVINSITIKRKLKPEIKRFIEIKEKEFKNFSPTQFNGRVYELAKQIPTGYVSTYSIIAKKIGCNAYQAVGNALNKNPYSPMVPCHRIVNNNGNVGGFASGTKNKIKMLQKEGINVKNNRIVNFENVLFKFDK